MRSSDQHLSLRMHFSRKVQGILHSLTAIREAGRESTGDRNRAPLGLPIRKSQAIRPNPPHLVSPLTIHYGDISTADLESVHITDIS